MSEKEKNPVLKRLKKKLNKKDYKQVESVVSDLKATRERFGTLESQLLAHFPTEVADTLRDSLNRLHDTSFVSDPIAASKEINFMNRTFATAVKGLPKESVKAINLVNGTDAIGYEPAGSLLRRLYPNPFAVFAFLGDNYWAAVLARRHVRVEVDCDGVKWVTLERTPQKRVKLVKDALTELRILPNRTELVDHLNLFGNAWLKPKRNILGGIRYYEVLLPERMLPIWDRNSDKLLGWQYHVNNTRYIYSVEEIVHLKTYSTRSQYIGAPGLASIVVDLEAAMFASLFNSTVFQKGGMIGNIISLKPLDQSNLINEKNYSLLADTVQARFDKRYAGVRGAAQTIISPYVDKVFKLMSIGEMDGSFKTMTELTDKKCAQLLCCSPEKLGIPITSQYQNKDMTSDRLSESFDNTVYYLTTIVDSWINSVIKSLLGIGDVTIESGSAYKAGAVNAAQYGNLMAQIGGVMTIDEYRTEILKMEPYGGDLGRRFLDNSRNRDMVASGGGEGVAPTMGAAPAELGPALPNYNFEAIKFIKHINERVDYYPSYTTITEVIKDMDKASVRVIKKVDPKDKKKQPKIVLTK